MSLPRLLSSPLVRSSVLSVLVSSACATRDARRDVPVFWCAYAPLNTRTRECFRSKHWCDRYDPQCDPQPRAYCTGRRIGDGGPELEACFRTREECELEQGDAPCTALEPEGPGLAGIEKGI